MPRTYTVSFENVVISAAQDLIQIKGASNKVLRVKRLWLGMTSTTLQTAQGLRLRVRQLPATVTDGSGGSTPTPQLLSPGDAAASFTALVNNTTPATTSGTAHVLYDRGVHNYSGDDLVFAVPPEVIPSTSIVYELLSTVLGTCAFSGGAEVEEYG